MLIAALIALAIAIVIVVTVLVVRSMRGRGSVSVRDDVSSIGSATPLDMGGGSSTKTNNASGTSTGHSPYDRIRPRFMAMYVLIAAIFGSLGTKLWSMQVLNSEKYLSDSQDNLLTTIKTPASRGRIFDTEGIELVRNQINATILADADVASQHDVIVRLSALLGLPYNVIRQRIQDSTNGAQAQRVVTSSPRERDVAYIAEHPDAFNGISIEDRPHRVYPYEALACQLLGYAGTVSQEELDNAPEGSDYQSGDEVGKSGIEATYESLLSGTHGERVVVADVDGTVHEVKSETRPTQGNDVYLTISARVQAVAEQAMAKLIAPYGTIGDGIGTAGAVVGMDLSNGDVVCLANFPNFNPANFIGGISQDDWDRYNDDDGYRPLMNRAIAGTYPAASTFKSFTGAAAIHYGFVTEGSGWNCTGEWTGFGDDYAQKCWDTDGHGYLNFREGIVYSCDVVFYDIAAQFYYARNEIGDAAMQEYVKLFGFSQATGIPLSGEATGVVPTPEWKKEYYSNQPEEAQWVPGDMTNTAIGQGNVLITPIQLAVAYGGIATGKLFTPNLLKEVRNSEGEIVLEGERSSRDLDTSLIDDKVMDTIRDALRGVALEDGDIPKMIEEYGYQAACKTGSGEAGNGRDAYSWFAVYAPYDNPKYVVTCVIEDGGFGVDAGVPVALEVMDACLKFGDGELTDDVPVIPEVTSWHAYVPTNSGERGE
ncbi:Peptidoglycan synthase FtsI precursor [Slackia heliotrinireducens]|uniref:Penicillin-binding protein 2 n=1 Tax=Slackia heliotrinireducens (strain ATCC 29202 / DSM 20476 / NCTC 11029 / RHS 1) TaxID=471855 RepID=C7N6A6_SLAHD|nr:penicillin-binding protein 2 [Slackia heliotrinireducens]ACV22441.1 penicillin-binding protein 2 [Slackia heliotrinireducens DSM 20476]VEH00795.1 Peptidoglycan synthase FtsI precursor [Slackia heliotrinireducens]